MQSVDGSRILNMAVAPFSDILSFYKEELAGESDNFIHLQGTAHGKDPWEVIQEIVEESVQAFRRLDMIFQEDAGLHRLVVGFLHVRRSAWCSLSMYR